MQTNKQTYFPPGKPFIAGPVSLINSVDFDDLYSQIKYPQNIVQCNFFMRDSDMPDVIDMFAPKIIFDNMRQDKKWTHYFWVACSIQKM